MVSYLLVLVIFAFVSYMMTISNFKEIHIAGLICFGGCFLAFIVMCIVYFINNKNKE